MAVVAVLEMSMENTMVTIIRPKSTRFGSEPHTFIVRRMRSASSFVFVIADARKKPPIINQITLLENVLRYISMSWGVVVNNSEPSVKARYARMNNPTANGGMASVSHRPMEKQRRKRT